ncbi:peptidylprolyl isomerase [Bacteriovoracaceae bacterium]|nr:peptidylprolyl isomerase [Bacteriovoracaceae bacterium]
MLKTLSVLTTTFLLSMNAYSAPKDPVVATVNGRKITLSALEKAYNQNLLFVSDKIVTKEKVLNDLINKELGVHRALKANLDDNPIVKEKLNDILYHAQISKDNEQRLKKIVVTDDDVKSYYNNHPEYRTAHILFRVRATPEKEETKAAITQALKVYEQLKKDPSKFAELANKYSQSSTAPSGGDMGFVPAVRMAPEYFRAINGKPNDFITPPVRTQFGYHIIKVIAKKDYKSINTPMYKKIVYDRKRDTVLSNYFKELRKGQKVSINKKLLK